MATLKDVARLACVDVSTVSRALNNTSYVHPDTKARIYAAAKELGYHPNIVAQALRQGRRHTIGVVVPRLHITIFSEILQGIERRARKLGYSTLICTTEDDPKVEKDCLSRLRSGFVDGIILAGTGRNGRLVRDIQASGISMLQIVRCQDARISSIVADYRVCGADAAKYLRARGCRKLGLINGSFQYAPIRSGMRASPRRWRPWVWKPTSVSQTGPSTALSTATTAPTSCWTRPPTWTPSWRRWMSRGWGPSGRSPSGGSGSPTRSRSSASPAMRSGPCSRPP